jgi:hypothetical protein
VKLAEYTALFMRSARFDKSPAALRESIVGAGKLDATAALDVYRRMYWHRLVQAHFDLFEISAAYLGERTFTELVCACVAAQPSNVHALEQLALPFADYARKSQSDGVASDLIDYEAAWLGALTSPNSGNPVVVFGDLADPASFNKTAIAHTALRVVAIDAKAAATAKLDIAIPIELEKAELSSGDSMPPRCYFAITRPGHHVRTMRISTGEHTLLRNTSPTPLAGWLALYGSAFGDPQGIFARLSQLIGHGVFCWHRPSAEDI